MAYILVTGTRHATIADHGYQITTAIRDLAGPVVTEPHRLYVGDCDSGVDLIARQYFTPHPDWRVLEFEARWEECGPGCPAREHRIWRGRRCPVAGPRRNATMATQFVADGGRIGVSFPERGHSFAKSGTWDCTLRATNLGVAMRVESLQVVRR